MFCEKCELSKTRRTIVEGIGPIPSTIMFVGEAPGAAEDKQGIPFVGESGKVFDEILERVGLKREDVFITNVVRCRPPQNRNPKPSEIRACLPFLLEEIKKVKPNVIVPLGNVALKALTDLTGVSYFEGKILFHPVFDCFIIPCLHPAALFRDLQENLFYRFKRTTEVFRLVKEFRNVKLRRVKRTRLIVEDITSFRKLLTLCAHSDEFGFDIETSGFDFLSDKILGLSFSFFDKKFVDFFVPVKNVDFEELKKFFENRKTVLVGHNVKFDARFLLSQFGIDLFKGPVFDTMIAYYLLNEDAKGYYDLKTLSWQFGIDFGGYEDELRKLLPSRKASFETIPLNVLGRYACLDAEAVLRLRRKLEPRLKKEEGLLPIFETLMRAERVFLEIELNGLKVDFQYLEALEKKFEERQTKLLNEIRKLVNKPNLNVNSTKQIREVFLELGIESPKVTKTGLPSTGTEALNLLKGTHPFVDLLLQYREGSTLFNTHIKGVKEKILKDGKVHTTFLLHGTATGRITCAKPNIQQVPKTKEFRNIYIAEKGNVLIEADYSQMELRVLAHFSEDPVLIEAYKNEEDIHTKVAMEVFKVSEEEAKKYRKIAKCVSGDTYITTVNGIFKIKDLVDHRSEGFRDKEFVIESLESDVLVKQTYFGGLQEVFEVTTDNGLFLEATKDHEFLCLINDRLVLKRLEDLKVGDVLLYKINTRSFGKDLKKLPNIVFKKKTSYKRLYLPEKLDKRVATFLGYYVSEGSREGYCIELGLSPENEEALKDLESIVTSLFGERVRRVVYSEKYKGFVSFRISSKDLYFLLKALDVGFSSRRKRIPDLVLQSPKGVQVEFLRRLFEGDGAVGSKGVGYCSKSKELVKQLQLMLLNFGIFCKSFKQKNKKYGDYFYLLVQDRTSLEIFRDEINFVSSAKQRKLTECLSRKHGRSSVVFYGLSQDELKKVGKILPKEEQRRFFSNYGFKNASRIGLSKVRKLSRYFVGKDFLLARLLKYNVYPTKIVKIESVGKKEVFDLFAPDRPLMISNGIFTKDSINFGLLYGRGEQSLAEALGISIQEAREYIQRYFERLPRVRWFRQQMRDTVRKQGYVVSLFGRRRRLFDSIWSGDGYREAEAERQAMNFPIQSSASDITMLAMIKFFETIDRPCRLVNFVHDAILVECRKEEADYVADFLRKTMENVVTLKVPLKADIKIGRSWGDCLDE